MLDITSSVLFPECDALSTKTGLAKSCVFASLASPISHEAQDLLAKRIPPLISFSSFTD
jgi:hypothetical protein